MRAGAGIASRQKRGKVLMSEVNAAGMMESPAQAAQEEEEMLALGLHHWNRGDVVEAYKWLVLAAGFNNPYASIHEKELLREMSADQVTESRRRASAVRTDAISISPMALGSRGSMPVDAIA
ncbi:MAG: hypothetical protein KDJ88_15615 [Bauldia sp.]|nr:hypothetical protein [Bauldia sp.]